MNGGIFVIGTDGGLRKLVETSYETEALLQILLAQYPELLPGEQIDPTSPRRWLLIDREAGVPKEEGGGDNWSLDHLFIDQEGVPTLVEVKRSTDTRIRREVVAQMLDYAANGMVYWPIETIVAKFEGRCDREARDSAECLEQFLQAECSTEEFWTMVKTNLQAGRVRMVFVADAIPPELRRIVEFLNSQMDPAEVLAVEVKQYTGGGLQSLVPRVVGLSAQAQQKKAGKTAPKVKWDQEAYFRDIASRCDQADVNVARKLLSWAQEKCDDVWWGEGKTYGSFVPRVFHNGQKHQMFAAWSSGYFEFYFQWYGSKPPFNDPRLLQTLFERLNAVEGLSLPGDSLKRRPSVPLQTLRSEQACTGLLSVLEWMIGEIRDT